MKAKITKLEFKKTWTGNHGEMHSFFVEFDNAQKGEVNFKSKEPWAKIGDEVEYTSTPNGEYPDRIKMEQVKEFKQGFKQGGDRKGFALSYAKDLVVAGTIPLSQILETADKFLAWMEDGTKGDEKKEVELGEANTGEEERSDGLPF
jgi:hypothetical protein